MAADEESRELVWEGKLPVCFAVHPDETRHHRDSGSNCYYMLVPRVTYFPIVLDKVDAHFRRVSGADREDMPWLEYKRSPLKWQYPVGVLYDMLNIDKGQPWMIYIRYKDFPSDKIVNFNSRMAMKAYFLAKIKEADYLKHKSEILNQFKPDDFENLWNALAKDDYGLFWSTCKRLMVDVRGGKAPFKYIPFIIYTPDGNRTQGLMPAVESVKATQEEDCDVFQTKDHTLGHLLTKFNVDHESGNSLQVLIQGISVSMETPLQWLSECLCFPDNFIHIVIKQNLY